MYLISILDQTGGDVFKGSDLSVMTMFANQWAVPFCLAYDFKPMEFDLIQSPDEVDPLCQKIFTWKHNDSNVPGAAGFHDEINGVPYAELLTDPFLNAGGGILDGGSAGVSLLSILLHEAGEMRRDEPCDDWVLMPNGIFIAAEVSDPVQGVVYNLTLPDGTRGLASDAVTPAYFDGQNTNGPFSLAGAPSAPFALLPNGYQILFDPSKINDPNGPISNVFGDMMPDWLKMYKMLPNACTQKRARKFKNLQTTTPNETSLNETEMTAIHKEVYKAAMSTMTVPEQVEKLAETFDKRGYQFEARGLRRRAASLKR